MVLICTKGADAKDGNKGQNGTNGGVGGNGSNGTDGGNGQDGVNAQNKELNLSCNEQNQLIIDGQNTKLALGSTDCQITILASGGKGGKGGDGGNGGKGGDGQKGQNATSMQKGTDGGRGGNGGNGGNGGQGGNGGHGGHIIVTCSKTQTDLFYLITGLNISGGQRGLGGKGGQYGQSGRGGQGGNSFQGVNGQKSFPSGNKGQDGQSGQSGKQGKDGNQGSCGSFSYRIAETGELHKSLFNLILGKVEEIKSDDGIIEPGEKFQIKISVLNNTTMSTPQGSKVTVSIVDDPYIIQSQDNKCYFSDAIHPNQTLALPKEFSFEINKQNLTPSLNSQLSVNIKLKFKAILNRVNGEFKGVSNYEQNMKVEYPVELSFIAGPRSVLEDEESPIVIGIKNKSKKPLGIIHGRLLNLRFYNDSKQGSVKFFSYNQEEDQIMAKNNKILQAQQALNSVNFINKNENDSKSELLQQMFIPSLQPNQQIFFKGTVKITDPTIQSYESVNLRFCLDIGHIEDPANKYQTIQEMSMKLQKGETLQYKETSDVVLIVNQEIERETLMNLRNKLKIFDIECDIYSISQYKTFRYRFDPYKIAAKPLQKKVIAIFGNNYRDYQNQLTNAPKTIGYSEIFEASYQDDSRTYIMGQQKNIKFGRIFNYSALELYRNTLQHNQSQTFNYHENFKIMIPDLSLTHFQYMNKYKERQQTRRDSFALLSESQNPLIQEEENNSPQQIVQAREPDIYDEFTGIEDDCILLIQSSQNQKKEMKNLEEIVKYYQVNPEKVEGIRNLNTAYRLPPLNQNTYMNDTFDEKNLIKKQIQNTHETLSKLDPCNQYLTRHLYRNSESRTPNFLEKYIGKSYKSSGYMYVAKGLRKDCSQIIFREKNDVEINKIDDGDIYNILKLLPATKKVGYINKMKEQCDQSADILFAAIGSDLCAEFNAHTQILIRSGWKLPKYLNEMQGWKAINEFDFQPLVKEKNIFILKKFLVMIKSVNKVIKDSVHFSLKAFSCCSCLPFPSIVILKLISNITSKVESSISACSGAKDKADNLINTKFGNLKNQKQQFDLIARPDRQYSQSTTFLSNQPSAIVYAYDPLPAWIKQELQMGINISDTIKIEIKQKQLYQSAKSRLNEIDKYMNEILNAKS